MDQATVEYIEGITAREAKGGATEAEKKFLRQPENLDEWYAALQAINHQLETQFLEKKSDAQEFQNKCYRQGAAGKADWFDYKASYDRWRAGAKRFKSSIEKRMGECRRLRHAHTEESETGKMYALLRSVLGYLEDDSNITYGGVVERDALIEEIRKIVKDDR